MLLLELRPTIFESNPLQLVVDRLGFCIGLGVPLQFFQLLDPLTVGFDCVLQRLALRVNFSDYLL